MPEPVSLYHFPENFWGFKLDIFQIAFSLELVPDSSPLDEKKDWY